MPLNRTMPSNRALGLFAAMAAGVAALFAGPALAHPGHDATARIAAGFAGGFTHPLSGFDHLLAMVAVGLWAVQQAAKDDGRLRALWLLPTAFVLAMAAGFGIGFSGFALSGVETGIALSVLVFGLVVALAARPPLAVAVAITAALALFHGYAHGIEMPAAGGEMALRYGTGMLAATAILHAAGLGAARLSQRFALPLLTRAAGAAVAVAGAVILVG